MPTGTIKKLVSDRGFGYCSSKGCDDDPPGSTGRIIRVEVP